jgi:hypothetical protein
MTNNEQILQMIKNGDVSVEDAIGMMGSGATSPNEQPAALPTPASTDKARWFRVRVTNLATGKNKVSVNIPLNLMKWGWALGSRFAPELHNMDLDDMMSDLDQFAGGRIVEVEDVDDNERVEIYID